MHKTKTFLQDDISISLLTVIDMASPLLHTQTLESIGGVCHLNSHQNTRNGKEMLKNITCVACVVGILCSVLFNFLRALNYEACL